jgi:hypothetical protein
MAQTFSVSTVNNKQDAALALAAAKDGKTVDQYVQAQFARVVQRAINERERDDAAAVGTAYLAASTAVQNQIRAALGL